MSVPERFPEPGERLPILTARRDVKMASSAHAYVRGSTAKFYDWLEAVKPGSLPDGTPLWICGDCHSGNLGPIGDADGIVVISIRDLDQTVIGNPAHDLIRLGLSLATSVRDSVLAGATLVKVIEGMADGYAQGLLDTKKGEMPKCVRGTFREALNRKWKHLAEERITDASPRIPLGKRFWPLSKREKLAVERLIESEDVRALVTMLRPRDDDAEIHVLDAAYWMKGCSSLGRLRVAVIVGVGKPPYDGKTLCLLDIKEAVTAAAPRNPHAEMPRRHGERVVSGAINLTPALGSRMRAGEMLGKQVFVRELLPQDLKIEIDRLSEPQAIKAGRFLSHVVGTAHARQLNLAERRRWRRELLRARSKSLDAPSWLWRSVADLVGMHETAYLDHCRRVANAAAGRAQLQD